MPRRYFDKEVWLGEAGKTQWHLMQSPLGVLKENFAVSLLWQATGPLEPLSVQGMKGMGYGEKTCIVGTFGCSA